MFRVHFFENWSESLSIALTGFGVFIFALIPYLQYEKVIKIKGIRGLNKGFLVGQLIFWFFLGISEAFLLASKKGTQSVSYACIGLSVLFFVTNLYFLFLKQQGVDMVENKKLRPNASHLRSVGGGVW